MFKLFISLLAMIAMTTGNFAQDLQEKFKDGDESSVEETSDEKVSVRSEKYPNAIYLHPMTLWIGPATDYWLPLMIYVTFEQHLKGNMGFVVKPNFKYYNPKLKDLTNDVSYGTSYSQYKYISFGAQPGIRFFSNGFKGYFFEAGLDLTYYSQTWTTKFYDEPAETTDNSTFRFGPMLSVGYKSSFAGSLSFYTDLGLGYGISINNVKNIDGSEDVGGLLADFNIGIGLSF